MKKNLLVILLSLAFLPAVHAGIGAFGSWWDTKDCDTLYGAGVRLSMDLVSGFGIEARGSYMASDLDDVDMNVVPLEAAVSWVWNVSDYVNPYIGAGIGYYIVDADWESRHLDDEIKSNDCLGYFAMAGLNVNLGPLTLFGEAKYNLIGDDDSLEWRGSDLSETFALDGISVNAGVKIGF